LSSLIDKLVDPVLERYGIPEWIKPYVLRYVRSNPANTVKFAASFIDVKRKKGEVTSEYIRLPNGLKFKIDHVLRLLNLVFYGEESMARIAKAWSEGRSDPNPNPDYTAHFREMSASDAKHARAIKNLIEGLGRKLDKPQEELVEVFDYVSKLESWPERVIATEIILRDSYAKSFGLIFYKVFYPVSPEFMRSFGKAFLDSGSGSEWGAAEARKIISGGLVPEDRIVELTREVLVKILNSIDANMRLAVISGIENEARLLSDIAIAYPFQNLSQLGVKIDIPGEIKRVKRAAAKRK
jgi:hypothetical protein